MTDAASSLVKKCPRCSSERPLAEAFCQNVVEGASCGFRLVEIKPTSPGRPKPETSQGVDTDGALDRLASLTCPNGHVVAEGNLLCPDCGELVEQPAAVETEVERPGTGTGTDEGGLSEETVIDGWRMLSNISNPGSVRCRYIVEGEGGRIGVLTLYDAEGAEPDPEVYDELRRLSLDHIPEIYATGRHEGLAYDVAEDIDHGNLDDLEVLPTDTDKLRVVAYEIAKALRDFNRVGLRHRDLRPHAVLTRTTDPLDLVIDGFGSAQLSEHDLETVAPLEQTRYMAPEAIAGAVSPASDWWSLGVMLLEKATGGTCFDGISDQAFVIHTMAHGIVVPDDVHAEIATLLRGLLVRDHAQRWQWPEFERWYEGDPPKPPLERPTVEPEKGPKLEIGGVPCRRATSYALTAARAENWDDAIDQLIRGEILTWLEDIGESAKMRAAIKALDNKELEEDVRLAIALKHLNPNLPLIHRGDIISPSWLLRYPKEGRALLAGEAPDLLAALDSEKWLARLKAREAAVRERAKHHDIDLVEASLDVLLLSTNRAKLSAQWAAMRKQYPDTEHHGLAAVMDRRTMTEEDLILLLGADPSQLLTADEVVSEAVTFADNAHVESFSKEDGLALLQAHTRVELMQLIDERTSNFGRSGNAAVDDWVDQFRIQRRMSLPRALVTLSLEEDLWEVPKSQVYVKQIISFFEQKATFSITRGPLARMTIAKSSTKIDIIELGTKTQPAKTLLEAVIRKTGIPYKLDPHTFIDDPSLERRLQRLQRHALLYKRDTGIDGLYLGFPFVVFSPSGSTILPRIAPILLWPIKLSSAVGRRDLYTISFDTDRDQVNLNPALEGFFGEKMFSEWKKRRDALLAGALDLSAVMAEFGQDFEAMSEDLAGLPPATIEMARGTGRIACAAVLFHVTYMAQAIVEDLKQLKARPPDDTALAALLRLSGDHERITRTATVPELERFFTVGSDPSQEQAVIAARNGPGLVIEGPPGTGKSQTIVNLIGDAIGRKRSVAVICQKQAALEVVKKRLVAEGLADRLVLVTDENKDRRRVLEDIRDQLDGLKRAPAQDRLASDRRTTAHIIETIESELADHHDALHAHDDQAGVSYRELIGELVQLEESPHALLDNYPLQRALKGFTRTQLETVINEIAPTAADWLDSGYEGSPLRDLAEFGWDEAAVFAFTKVFDDFEVAERARTDYVLLNAPYFECEAPGELGNWRDAHGKRFDTLLTDERIDLKTWSKLFHRNGAPVSEGMSALGALERLTSHLSEAESSAHDPDDHEILCQQSEGATQEWIKQAVIATREVGFLGRLNPSRWWARRRIRKLIQRSGESIGDARMREFLRAAKLELHIKATRTRAREFARSLSLPNIATKLEAADIQQLNAAINEMIDRLSAVLAHAELLLQCPACIEAFKAVADERLFSVFLDSCGIIMKRYALETESHTRLDTLDGWIKDGWIADRRQDIDKRSDTTEITASIVERYKTIAAYQKFRARSTTLSDDAWAILDLLRLSDSELREISSRHLGDEIRRILGRQARLAWKARIESSSPVLLMSREEIENRIRQLKTVDREMRELNGKLLSSGIDKGRLGNEKQWEGITRYQGGRALRLREFVSRGADLGLMELRPVWLMNPDVASRLLPLQAGLFDVVVYDEASQMPIEYALPTLYRGKTAVVSGDEKQLPPTSFFHSKVESDEAEIFDGELPDEDLSEEELEEYETIWNRREIKDCPDLLALGRSSVPNTMLQIHYRSVYRELIEFSNSAFYRGELNVPARHPDEEIRKTRPIEVHRVDGTYTAQTNPDEASRIVDIVAGCWKAARGNRPSVGVLTFNRKQADLIEQEFSDRATADREFRAAYGQESMRVEDGEDMSFFVKNLENVQGDERDIIVFSTTFGLNATGVFRRNFGVLGQRGGERRLNVAVTRARRKVIIATSMPIAEISDMLQGKDRPSKPRDFLQTYLHYASLVSDGKLAEARNLLRLLSSGNAAIAPAHRNGEDGFFTAVGDFIAKLGYTPARANDGTAFGVDYAIPHPKHGQYGIAIECDAPRHEILATARARELWRPCVLGRAIRHVHRVSSQGWYHAPHAEKEILAQAIFEAIGGPAV